MIYFLKKKKEALNEEKYQQSNTSVNSKKKIPTYWDTSSQKMVKNLRSEKKNWFNNVL